MTSVTPTNLLHVNHQYAHLHVGWKPVNIRELAPNHYINLQ